VLDELEEVESAEHQDGDHRVVADHGIGEDLVNASSSRALSPVEGHTSTVAATKPKSRLRTCWVCGIQTRGKIRRHVLKEHLPWFWYAATAYWDCREQVTQKSSVAVGHSHLQQSSDDAMLDGHSQDHQIGCTFDDENIHHWCLLVNGSLHGFVKWLDCGSLDGLLQYVISRELHLSVTSGFCRQEEQILMFYVENYSPHMVTHLTLQPPNHVKLGVNCQLTSTCESRKTEQVCTSK